MDFSEADRLTGLGQKSFIGELMPKFPIYTTFMSEEARACIGQVHRHTRPALEMLKKEGLRWEGYIDIFDGGPTVEAYIDDVRAIRNSQLCQVEVSQNAPDESVSRWLAASTEMLNFTASWIGRRPSEENTIVLNPQEADRLGVTTGDHVRLLET